MGYAVMYANRPLMLGRYRLLAELGRGGMADVYLAASDGPGGHRQLDVIKRLRNLEDPQHMTMFLDEARIARRLNHPNIVKTYEIGQDAGSHFIAMEYLHGPTLQRLRSAAASRGQRVPWAMEIEILCNVLEGLHYAHELCGPDGRQLHVVHRDLSPENVIVTQSGDCKILDFGIAKAIDSLTHTQAGFIKGKLKNMPPEQLHGHRVDRRADVYAVGVMLWEGLTARPLWGELGNAAIATRLAQGSLPPLQDPTVPDELREMCARALDVNPERRYASALELRADLLSYVELNNLVITRDQLAEFVEPLFAEERERIDRVVQTLLYAKDPSVLETGPVPLPSAESFSAGGRTPPKRHRASETRLLTAAFDNQLDHQLDEPPRRRWLPILAVGAALALGLSIFAVSLRTSAPPLPATVAAPATVRPLTAPELPATLPSEEKTVPANRPSGVTTAGAGVAEALPLTADVERGSAQPAPRSAGRAGDPQPPSQAALTRGRPAAARGRQSIRGPGIRRTEGTRRPAESPFAEVSRVPPFLREPPAPVAPRATVPPAIAPEQPSEESSVRWLGRGLDRRNPYGGAAAPAAAPSAGSKRNIDRNNPWQGGN